MKKYVLIGAGSRGYEMFAKPIIKDFQSEAKLVGIFDINRTRAEYVAKNTDPGISVYTDFDKMMEETHPDIAIITTIDCYHHEYIIKAMEFGCDVISEKPMTIDEDKCNAILKAEKRTGKKLIVTFNCRFIPYIARIKELLNEGVVGKILSVDFEYMLDTSHGADYYRRWHRRKENSGGLLVHKATHHFDFINWWIGEDPIEIYANGTTRFYGSTREKKGERCSTCSYTKECEYKFEGFSDPECNEMYFKAEKEDGYFRDKCIFAEEINIEDSMSVMVKYSENTLLTYSLVAYSPYEGWKVSITGTNGRLEAEQYYSGHKANSAINQIYFYNRKGEMITYTIEKATGAHSGGDVKLRKMLFCENIPDPMGQFAGSKDGAKSIAIGISANKSIKENRTVYIKDLIMFV